MQYGISQVFADSNQVGLFLKGMLSVHNTSERALSTIWKVENQAFLT
jgi:hypothetical protein